MSVELLASEVKRWWEEEFARHPEWGLSRCRIERDINGDGESADQCVLVVHGWEDRVALVGILSAGTTASPASRDLELVARRARREMAAFAFASDGTRVVLVDAFIGRSEDDPLAAPLEALVGSGGGKVGGAGDVGSDCDPWKEAIRVLVSLIHEEIELVRRPGDGYI